MQEETVEFKYGAELAVLFPSFLPVTSAHLFHFPSVFFKVQAPTLRSTTITV